MHLHLSLHIHIYVHVCTYMYTYWYTCPCAYAYTHAHGRTCIHNYVHACTHGYMHTCVHTYASMQTRTIYIHTLIITSLPSCLPKTDLAGWLDTASLPTYRPTYLARSLWLAACWLVATYLPLSLPPAFVKSSFLCFQKLEQLVVPAARADLFVSVSPSLTPCLCLLPCSAKPDPALYETLVDRLLLPLNQERKCGAA